MAQIDRIAKRFFDVACHGAPACEPKRHRITQKRPPRPEEMVVGAIEQLHAKTLPASASPKPDAPPQGEGGSERPLARCPLPQRRAEVSEARGPSLYVGDSSFQAWFPQEKLTEQIMETWWTEGGHAQCCVMWQGLSLGHSRVAERALINALKRFPEHQKVMWMMTPTLKGVNVDAIPKEHSNRLRHAEWYDSQGHRLFQCMKKHLGHWKDGIHFMARGVHGIWGPPPTSCPYPTTAICIEQLQEGATWTLPALRKGA